MLTRTLSTPQDVNEPVEVSEFSARLGEDNVQGECHLSPWAASAQVSESPKQPFDLDPLEGGESRRAAIGSIPRGFLR